MCMYIYIYILCVFPHVYDQYARARAASAARIGEDTRAAPELRYSCYIDPHHSYLVAARVLKEPTITTQGYSAQALCDRVGIWRTV